jgi:serine/threonine-protein kinase
MNVTTSVGRVLGDRYQVDEVLGRGGMATVWRGRDLRLDRAVAIKELAGPWLADHAALRQFDREARMAARLAHPNIVAVNDVDVHDGSPFIVMELIEGSTVARLLADGPLAIEAVVAIAAQVCDGLAAAHAAGVIHRDIKPANLMVTGTGVVKICDFGIARGLLGAPDPTVSGPLVAIGTSKYMAPEQASGGHVDARADLYGLGCTLYAMLAGTPPFHGSVPEVLAQQQFQAPVPLRTHRGEVPVPLDALVMRLLAKDPAHRPGCAQIKAVLADLAADATPALIPVSASASVAVARAAVPAVGRGVVWVPSDPRRRARVLRYGSLAAVGLVAVLISSAAAWRMAPHQTGNSGVALVAPSTPSVSTTPAMSTPPSASAPAPTRTAQASQVSPPSAPPSSPAPPSDPIAALRLAVQQQVSTGNLNPDKASALYPKVDAIAHAANAGNLTDEAKNIKAFKDSLMPLRTGGQLSVAGYNVLSDAADAISATLP